MEMIFDCFLENFTINCSTYIIYLQIKISLCFEENKFKAIDVMYGVEDVIVESQVVSSQIG